MKNNKWIYIRNLIKDVLEGNPYYNNYLLKTGKIIKYDDVKAVLDKAPELFFESPINHKPKVGIVNVSHMKDIYVPVSSSWLRYERFCKNNKIEYGFYNIFRSDWIEEAKFYDIIIWNTPSIPSIQYIAESKIYILEKIMQKFCFPSFDEIWQYEDKNRSNYLYQCLNIPTIPTTITNSKVEAISLLQNSEYPIITKTKIGSGSTGVVKIYSKKQALKRIKKVFNSKGLRTQYKYKKQKDYFYIQKFIDDSTFDLRVIIIGNKAFGYYRYPNKGDYRASGAGNVEKKAIPTAALLLAIDVRNKLNSRQMGVDMLYSEKEKQYLIIETSLFNRIDTPEQLVIDGLAGYYDISDINNIVFKEGRFWLQELLLRDLINQWVEENK